MSAGLHGHVEALRTGDGGAKDAAVRALVEPAGTEKYANDREEHAANRVAIVAAGGIAPLVELARGGSAGAKGQAAGALASLAHADQKVAIAEAGGIAPLNDVTTGTRFYHTPFSAALSPLSRKLAAALHVSAVGRLGREPVGPVLGDAHGTRVEGSQW